VLELTFLWGLFDKLAPEVCAPPPILRVTPAGKRLIKRAEGFRSAPYICAAGVATIGWGSTIDACGLPVTLDHPPITRRYAQKLFDRDLALFGHGVRKLVLFDINKNQYSALVSLAYNIGLGRFRASTLLSKLNRGDIGGCAGEFWKWRRANGVILKGLVIRRELEKNMFLS